jgi:uracil phosphoribosyltransferase
MSEIINFIKENSILHNYLMEIRDVQVQKDSMRFRRNLERMGEIMAYELSKKLSYTEVDIETPLSEAKCNIVENQPVLAAILRAALPLHQGFLNYFDQAENAFISAYRKHTTAEKFEIEIEYLSSPSIEEKELILIDPMLATGSSMLLAYRAMLERGTPSHIHVVSVIASQEGLDYCKQHMPDNTTFWMAAIDDELTAQSYIVPGLGDAGDLAYGAKE